LSFKARPLAKKYQNGISSRLQPLGKLYQDYSIPSGSLTIDLSSLPLLTIDKHPIYRKEEIAHFVKTSRTNSALLPTLYGTVFEESLDLNRDYFNKIDLDFSGLNLKVIHLNQVGLHRAFSDGGCGRWLRWSPKFGQGVKIGFCS